MNSTFYVKDYLKDSITDSEAIKACLADAAKVEEKTVIISGKDYFLDEAIVLPSNTHVIIDNCTLKQNDRVFDNIFRGENVKVNPEEPYGYPLDVDTIENIKIEGRGAAKLIGTDVPRVGYHPGKNEYQKMIGDFWGWRTMMISFAKADNVEISGVELSQTMCWAITFEWSTNVYLHDMAIYSDCKNGDGIDFRSGCHHCRVENVTGYTSDDGVACTALSKGTRATYPNKKSVYPMTVAAGCAEGYSNDIHDIEVKNVKVGGLHHGMICLAANGNKVYNVNIQNLEEGEEGAKHSALCIYTGYGDGYTPGDINNINVDGIVARHSAYALEIRADVRDINVTGVVQENPKGNQYGIYPAAEKKADYARTATTDGKTLEDIGDKLFSSYRDDFIRRIELSLPGLDISKLDFEKLAGLSHKYGVILECIHLPTSSVDGIDISNPALADASVDMMIDIIKRAMSSKLYKFSTFAVSPCAVPVSDGEREGRMECAKRSLARLAEAAAECGAVIAVKNLPDGYLGSSSAEMLELLSAHPTLKVYFDSNNLASEEPSDFLAAFGERVLVPLP